MAVDAVVVEDIDKDEEEEDDDYDMPPLIGWHDQDPDSDSKGEDTEHITNKLPSNQPQPCQKYQPASTGLATLSSSPAPSHHRHYPDTIIVWSGSCDYTY